MCFSAGASFAGGAVLSAIGVATIKTNNLPSHKLFAGIPLFFAFQQFSEGVVWLTLSSGNNQLLLSAATYVFLLMALVIWPTLIPLAVFKMEDDPVKRKYLRPIIGAGLLLSAYYSICMLAFPVTPVINEFHIQYVNGFPYILGFVAFGIYIVATIAPLFISSVGKMKVFGWFIFISCFVTGIVYREYLTSVWCFFAAICSIVIYVIIYEAQPVPHKGFRMLQVINSHNPFRHR